MPGSEEKSPWICHLCDHTGHGTEGRACSECFKIACARHMTIVSILNQASGLYELKRVCSACQFKAQR